MKRELKALRAEMEREGLSAFLQPCTDLHGSEYIGAHDECVRFLSGFTGDSCTLLVLKRSAYLWTDGRYFVQAERELEGSGIRLMRMGEPGVPPLTEFLSKSMKKGQKLGADTGLLNARLGRLIKGILGKAGAELTDCPELIDRVWKDRPPRSRERVRVLPVSLSGEDVLSKLGRVRAEMKKEGAAVFMTGALDETAWLLNLRGSDIACNPVFLSFFILTERTASLYAERSAFDDEAISHLKACGVRLKPYERFDADAGRFKGKRTLLDLTAASFRTFALVNRANPVVDRLSPVSALKCVKNETEIRHMKESHVRDGVYLTKYLFWLSERMKAAGKRVEGEHCGSGRGNGEKASGSAGALLTETAASDVLDGLRASDPSYVSLSFPTISAYGENAAMCHYMAVPETAAGILPRGLYLVDSGAQYLDGTTDVTRTVAVGETTEEERRAYTLTVAGMLRLLNAVFPKGTRGINLDSFARGPLWKHGLDFNHGTGHGVGFYNSVHEMPVAVRLRPAQDPKRDLPFVPGMVTSDEPGVYIEGSFGVRTENLLLCVESKEHPGFLAFETLTYAPLDPAPLDLCYLTDEDIRNYNAYQEAVYEKLSPHLDEKERSWLRHETGPLVRV